MKTFNTGKVELVFVQIKENSYIDTWNEILRIDKKLTPLQGVVVINTFDNISEEQGSNLVEYSDYPNRRVYQDYETTND